MEFVIQNDTDRCFVAGNWQDGKSFAYITKVAEAKLFSNPYEAIRAIDARNSLNSDGVLFSLVPVELRPPAVPLIPERRI